MDSGQNHMKGIIEALLFISEKPIPLEQIKNVIEGVDKRDLGDLVMQLQKEYEERKSGIKIVEIAGGYQMLTSNAYAMYIKQFYRTTRKEKLSKPALETLAIIAYKQPVSRLDVELIRGVNSDGVVSHLFNKGLIRITGRKDVPGRPYLYGTTKQFLEYFGLKTLEDLPKLEDFSSLQSEEDLTQQDDAVDDEQEESQETKEQSQAQEVDEEKSSEEEGQPVDQQREAAS